MFNDLILAFHKDMYDKNELRIKEQKKQFAYYSGNAYEIEAYLLAALEKTYAMRGNTRSIDEMQLQWVNLTKKIINQMAVVYRDPAVRQLVFIEKKVKTVKDEEGIEKEVNANAEKEVELSKKFNLILPPDINIQDKRAHRLGALHNAVLTQVMLNENTGRIKYKTRSSYLYDIKLDSEGDIIEVSYIKYFKGKSGELEEFTIYWTDELLYMTDAQGNKLNLPKKDDATQRRGNDKNPFGVIPFALLVMEESDGWGEGKNDIINVNEQVNFLLTKLINRDIVLGEGVFVGTNLDLDSEGESVEGETDVRASVSHPITVEGVHTDMVRPSLQYVGTNPQIREVRETIDWYVMYVAGLNGLRGADIISKIKDTSDYQKIMDAVDQMELRRDDVEVLRNYEKERFDITKTVHNRFVGTEIGNRFKLKKIPDDVELKIDFADIVIHMTPEDLRQQRDWELPHGLSTEVDWVRQDNPDLTELEAKELIDKNKKYTKENEVKPISRFEQIAREGVNF